MRYNRDRFFAGYRARFGSSLSPEQVSSLETLLRLMEADSYLMQGSVRVQVSRVAYMLATVKHETADTYAPIAERGPKLYFLRYGPMTKAGEMLGNTERGDGYRFRGRGYCQTTGRANYRKLSKALTLRDQRAGFEKLDLERDPDALLHFPELAYAAMSYGMESGMYTGRKLSDYINETRTDFLQARRVINGMDKADRIRGYAQNFAGILFAARVEDVTV